MALDHLPQDQNALANGSAHMYASFIGNRPSGLEFQDFRPSGDGTPVLSRDVKVASMMACQVRSSLPS